MPLTLYDCPGPLRDAAEWLKQVASKFWQMGDICRDHSFINWLKDPFYYVGDRTREVAVKLDAADMWVDNITKEMIFRDPVGWLRGKLMYDFPPLYWFWADPRGYIDIKIKEIWGDWFNFTRDPVGYILSRLDAHIYFFHTLRTDPVGWLQGMFMTHFPPLYWFWADPGGYIQLKLEERVPFFYTLRTDPVGWLRGMFMAHFPPLYWFWIDPVSYVDLQIEARWSEWRDLRTDPGNYIFRKFLNTLEAGIDTGWALIEPILYKLLDARWD